MKDFAGKLALVTGAASGIGLATALAFCDEGARLALVDINADGLTRAASEVQRRGGTAMTYTVDMRDSEQVSSLHERVTAEMGTPDVLMNAAGICVVAAVEDIPLEDWESLLSLNLLGYVYTIHYFIRDMYARGGGQIVNVASAAGLFSVPYQSPYVTSKFAVVGLSEALRQEARRHKVGVTAVCPGAIQTPIIKGSKRIGFTEGVQKVERIAATPEGLARAIVNGVRKDKAIVAYPMYIRVLYRMKRFMPRVADHVGKAVARTMYWQHHDDTCERS